MDIFSYILGKKHGATPTQTKSATYTDNGDYAISPDTGYALSGASVSVAVPAAAGNSF